ncbi:MAG TPA: hypothetical protein VFW35_05785 [Sphingomicrobium sp.]|nr:hypothetical protein [Sphingomicrobium sp.]
MAVVLLGCAGCTAQERAAFASSSYTAADEPSTPSFADNAFPPPPPVDLPRVDPISGHMLAPIGSGAYVDPFSGTLYGPVGGGTVVNTQTGELIPG